MKVTTKFTFLLLSVLLIGIVIGAIGMSSYQRYRHKHRFERFRHGEGFISEMEKLIDPTVEQRDQIRQILDRHGEWVKKFSEEQRHMFMTGIDSLNKELSKVLTPEQMEKFTQRMRPPREAPFGRPRPPRPGEGPPPK